MFTSQRIRSGNSFWATCTPMEPLPASMTSYPFWDRANCTISRSHSSSSIIKIFFIFQTPQNQFLTYNKTSHEVYPLNLPHPETTILRCIKLRHQQPFCP